MQETVDAIAELRDGRLAGSAASSSTRCASRCCRRGALEPRRRRARLDAAGSAPTSRPAGLRAGDAPIVDGLLDEAHDHAERVDARAARAADDARRASGRPIVPAARAADGIDAGGVRELADLLIDQGMA